MEVNSRVSLHGPPIYFHRSNCWLAPITLVAFYLLPKWENNELLESREREDHQFSVSLFFLLHLCHSFPRSRLAVRGGKKYPFGFRNENRILLQNLERSCTRVIRAYSSYYIFFFHIHIPWLLLPQAKCHRNGTASFFFRESNLDF